MISRRPTRASPAGRVYLELQSLARRTGRPTDEVLQLYALECSVDRLSRSPHAQRFVLKGGVLLAAFAVRRPTRDVDLATQQIDLGLSGLLMTMKEIAAMPVNDGVHFAAGGAHAESIRDGDGHGGVRVSLSARLSRARLTLHVDINVGDPVWPEAAVTQIPRLLGGNLAVRGYPVAMVLAEKLVTAMQRGTANTRWRDFVDIAALARSHAPEADELLESMRRVGEHRAMQLAPLGTTLARYAKLAQARWAAWRRKERLQDGVPELFEELLASVLAFCDPLVFGAAAGRRWDPRRGAWM